MHLSKLIHLPILLTILLSTSASPFPNSALTPLHARTLGHHPPNDALSTSAQFSLGPFKVYMLKTIAILPIQLAASELSDFFTVIAQTGHVQKLSGRLTSSYNFRFGAIRMFLDTMPATAAADDAARPPLDWDLVMWIGSQLLEMVNLGWTDHFAAVFVDPGTKVRTFVTLQVVSAGLATIGYVDPETGQPIIPAMDYFAGSR